MRSEPQENYVYFEEKRNLDQDQNWIKNGAGTEIENRDNIGIMVKRVISRAAGKNFGWPFVAKLHPLPLFIADLTGLNIVALRLLTICVRTSFYGIEQRQHQCWAAHDRE
ncbi:hypothetical protein EVAR_64488_1 [Eumeta japonica]|uniref:Uncharacterized protein n=1 Tax=Eumeta variegata TaxID=151549 RepID=A0A4C1ZWM9_EUMVA|nr:hypothetical protein EVAR_64488_1 [Eumeta japonica]